jgi:hypothetical protein
MSDRHKVFISYHHAADQAYKDLFVRQFSQVIVDWSVRLNDIPDGLATETIRQRIRDEWLRDSTVTVVLIGQQTWQRKHVDWEIGSSLRSTMYNPRSGLLGVLLPTYRAPRPGHYDPYTIPPRLADNLGAPNSFGRIVSWTDNPIAMQAHIHEAFIRRNQEPPPNNGRDSFRNNRSGEQWSQ